MLMLGHLIPTDINTDIVRVEDALKIQRLILGFKILNDLASASFGSYIQHSRLVNTRLKGSQLDVFSL